MDNGDIKDTDQFQSTHSLRSATQFRSKLGVMFGFQSTHSLRSATSPTFGEGVKETVSIHALLAECDHSRSLVEKEISSFNPRTPCGVRRKRSINNYHKTIVSIHALLAECDPEHLAYRRKYLVSIHALLAECDSQPGRSTGPLDVSIHALLAECDSCVFQHQAKWVSFNPRTPCGVRHIIDAGPNGFRGFQSTHSLRSATFRQQKDVAQIAVSIHALLAECDLGLHPGFHAQREFQSTHSLRSATAPDLIHCYSTKQIILCANLPKKTVIARLLFLSIYLSIFYSQCITPIADLPGNSYELEVGAQAMFNSL